MRGFNLQGRRMKTQAADIHLTVYGTRSHGHTLTHTALTASNPTYGGVRRPYFI